jgi:hypothetical protein
MAMTVPVTAPAGWPTPFHSGFAQPNQLADFRERLMRYREVVDRAAAL